MGLCKCPKKKVTNQFCFEHKVNVCEYCMTSATHQKCIVGPYLQWLDDSAYEPVCSLCKDQLSNEPTVRLLCFHIYHLSCLNRYAAAMPPNTAPAGYSCPTCHKPIFPTTAANSPVANNLRRVLSDESWARIGLGMPLIESNDNSYSDLNQSSLSMASNDSMSDSVPQVVHHNPVHNPPNVPIAVNNVSNYINSNNDSSFGMNSNSRNSRSSEGRDSYKSLLDIDDDKYRRKSPMEFISRWLRSHATFANRRNNPMLTYRRIIIVSIIIFLLICTLVHYFLKFGRESADSDPMLDPRFNPNIRNEQINR